VKMISMFYFPNSNEFGVMEARSNDGSGEVSRTPSPRQRTSEHFDKTRRDQDIFLVI
jgi:hypothetical protein